MMVLALWAAQDAVPDRYEKQTIEGWTVLVDRELLGPRRELGDRILRFVRTKLAEVTLVVPEKPLAELRRVPIWIGVEAGTGAGAEYHPSRQWLVEHGHDPAKAKAVEIGNAAKLLDDWRRQPFVLLHELAHAYHDRVLGFDHPGIAAAYAGAVKEGRYESVLRYDGRKGRHYALTDAKEYFAEATEAYFGTNDFYPFVRPELREHDPGIFAVLEEVWGR
jgi:hypothetical protein